MLSEMPRNIEYGKHYNHTTLSKYDTLTIITYTFLKDYSWIHYIPKWNREMLRFSAKTTEYANSELRILTQRQRLTGILQHPEAKLCQPLRHERLPTRGTPRKQLLRKLLSLLVSPARISNFQVLSHAPLATTHQHWHQLLSSRIHLVCWRILFTKLRFRINFTCAMFTLFLCTCFDKKPIDVCLTEIKMKSLKQ